MRSHLFLFFIAAPLFFAAEDEDWERPSLIPKLDISQMQKSIMKYDKFVLLMHVKGCSRAEEFMPTMETIAAAVPNLAYGRVSTEAHPETRVAASTGVMLGAPALKAFFRNAPPKRRVLEYAGPPQLEAVLAWARAVDEWDGSDNTPVGWEVGKREDTIVKPAPKKAASKDSSAGAKKSKDEV